MTVYDDLFSDVNKMAVYIHESCIIDCYECSWPKSIPCYFKFESANVDDILNWLNSENSKDSN